VSIWGNSIQEEAFVRAYMDKGWSDDEIVDLWERMNPGGGSLRERNQFLGVVARVRGVAAAEACPPRLREVEIAYRKVGASRPSQKDVGAKMGADPRTDPSLPLGSWDHVLAVDASAHGGASPAVNLSAFAPAAVRSCRSP
jgi:hypothetical protein